MDIVRYIPYSNIYIYTMSCWQTNHWWMLTYKLIICLLWLLCLMTWVFLALVWGFDHWAVEPVGSIAWKRRIHGFGRYIFSTFCPNRRHIGFLLFTSRVVRQHWPPNLRLSFWTSLSAHRRHLKGFFNNVTSGRTEVALCSAQTTYCR